MNTYLGGLGEEPEQWNRWGSAHY